MNTQTNRYAPLKRMLDVLSSLSCLIMLSPVLAIVALLVLVNLGRPVLFAQPRPGKNGKVFTLYKFRTMRPDTEASGSAGDHKRITPLGSTLRALSLDELPSLWNVLRGDMSVVGPRPLLVQYLQHYTPEQARRHLVCPGITGLAQVNGRNALSWEEKFALDVRYVHTYSLLNDTKILIQTVKTVFTKSGISAEGHSTMPEFGADQPTTTAKDQEQRAAASDHQTGHSNG